MSGFCFTLVFFSLFNPNRVCLPLTEKKTGGSLIRFGGGDTKNSQELASSSSRDKNNNNNNNVVIRNTITATGLICITTLTYLHWGTIQTFFNREKFRTAIIQTLNDVASQGHRGLLLYTIGFVFWECCGLPTSVVETAAGMAFGFHKGLLGSFIGKTCGSILAFTLGRTLLSDVVGNKMDENETFGLIQEGVQKKPFQSALILRYSPFPQLIKNFALSITKPVTFPIFIVAISIHGFPFSLLWAALGHDSSMRLRASEMGESMTTNVVLNSILVFVTIFGFVVSPAITGWWLTDLRK
jgi:uncharacterized membrane protein YdjX (TVP38/TMEM64 family)